MIIWLASYPKSGNTWVRIFLSALLFSYKEVVINKEILRKIRNYPLINKDFTKFQRNNFINFINDNDKNKDFFYKNWITSQENLNLNNKINFLKTHNLLCKFGENKFTNLENTLAVIHIVRDPRNVITSLKNHYSKKSYHESKTFLFDEHRWIGIDNESKEVPTFIGSWKTNYESWKRFPKNYILIKYEDLLENPLKEFKKIVCHLKNFTNLKADEERIKTIIEKTSFENLKILENESIFDENVRDKKTKEIKKFFYLGPKNKWQDMLNDELVNEINEKFKTEMEELGYI